PGRLSIRPRRPPRCTRDPPRRPTETRDEEFDSWFCPIVRPKRGYADCIGRRREREARVQNLSYLQDRSGRDARIRALSGWRFAMHTINAPRIAVACAVASAVASLAACSPRPSPTLALAPQ